MVHFDKRRIPRVIVESFARLIWIDVAVHGNFNVVFWYESVISVGGGDLTVLFVSLEQKNTIEYAE